MIITNLTIYRSDSLDHEEVDLPLKTNFYGYVAWGEYPHSFAAVLDQEEIFRLIITKGGNCDLQVNKSFQNSNFYLSFSD